MSTQAQINANHENSKKSTGPVTEAGKATSSHNRGSHFLAGNTAFRVLNSESQEEFDTLVLVMQKDYDVRDDAESSIVHRMAQHEWMRRRAQRILDDQFDCNPKYLDPFPLARHPLIALMMRYQTAHERAFNTAFNQLLKLRAANAKEQIGFERQRLHAQDAERKKERHQGVEKARQVDIERRLIHALRTAANNPEALDLARSLKDRCQAA